MAERLAELASLGGAQANAAERLRHLGEVGVTEAVDLLPARAERAAVGRNDKPVLLA